MLNLVCKRCEGVAAWGEGRKRVVALHCKGGNGRTGTMICAILIDPDLFKEGHAICMVLIDL